MTQKLVDDAIQALNKIHEDQSVPFETRLANLKELREWVNDLIGAINEDIAREIKNQRMKT